MPKSLTLTLGGVAVVCCVHDRQKRVVTDPEHVLFLGHVAGHRFDPRAHKLIVCACCENLFVTGDDTPSLCAVCSGETTHQLSGSLPPPNEVIR